MWWFSFDIFGSLLLVVLFFVYFVIGGCLEFDSVVVVVFSFAALSNCFEYYFYCFCILKWWVGDLLFWLFIVQKAHRRGKDLGRRVGLYVEFPLLVQGPHITSQKGGAAC